MIWCSILTLLLAEPRHSVAFIPGLFHPCHSSSENKPGFGMDIVHIPISEMDWSMGRTYRTLQGCTKATYRKEWVSSRAPLGTFFMSYSGILINEIDILEQKKNVPEQAQGWQLDFLQVRASCPFPMYFQFGLPCLPSQCLSGSCPGSG